MNVICQSIKKSMGCNYLTRSIISKLRNVFFKCVKSLSVVNKVESFNTLTNAFFMKNKMNHKRHKSATKELKNPTKTNLINSSCDKYYN